MGQLRSEILKHNDINKYQTPNTYQEGEDLICKTCTQDNNSIKIHYSCNDHIKCYPDSNQALSVKKGTSILCEIL